MAMADLHQQLAELHRRRATKRLSAEAAAPPPARVLTMVEAGKRLGVCDDTVRKLTRDPRHPLPTVTMGSRVGISEAALAQWIAEEPARERERTAEQRAKTAEARRQLGITAAAAQARIGGMKKAGLSRKETGPRTRGSHRSSDKPSRSL